MDFDALTAALVRACRDTDGVDGLVLLGSASTRAASRRDEWSDHDVYVLLADDRADALRSSLAFVPMAERIATRTRESHLGFAVLYDDGHLLEFAAGTADELGVVRSGQFEVVQDTADGTLAAIAERTSRPEVDLLTPAEHTALAIIKLMVGIGRARRGELASASQFIHSHALTHLAMAVRTRVPPPGAIHRDPLDPVRRLERDYPDLGAHLAAVLDQPLEAAARGTFDLLRTTLEPGWSGFPTAAADAVARRLGWEATAD
jgi:hypothetical protein